MRSRATLPNVNNDPFEAQSTRQNPPQRCRQSGRGVAKNETKGEPWLDFTVLGIFVRHFLVNITDKQPLTVHNCL